jgi:hypothetical protein
MSMRAHRSTHRSRHRRGPAILIVLTLIGLASTSAAEAGPGHRAGAGESNAGLPAATPEPAAASAEAVDTTAGFAAEYTASLTAGVSVTFQTVNLSIRSNPVLHLMDPKGTQVAVDDNGAGGSAARLTYVPPVSGSYLLILRARSSASGGTTDITKDGALWRTGVPFSGRQVWMSGLRSGEVLGTVRLPNGGGPTHLMYVLATDGLGIASRVSTGGTSGAVARTVTASIVGSRYVLLGIPRIKGHTTGPVRLVRNDGLLAGHDPDGDGLGTELETDIGTCSNLVDTVGDPEFECAQAMDARDTDGDGIGDRWEVLGRRDLSPHQPLPLWGSDPRHMDLFVEVDFMRRTVAENMARTDQRMPSSVARTWRNVFGDVATTSPLLRLYHARVLANPDSEPGIATHIDTGTAPTDPADATAFGDWGGHNAVNAVCAPTKCSGACDASGEKCEGATADASWMSNMVAARRGIFRYHLAYGDGGGQDGPGFTAMYNLNSAVNSIHETGHTLYLGHSGPEGGSQLPVNCKPNYPSLMSYSYYDDQYGFADGLGRSGINNAAVEEWGAVDPSNTAYLDDLATRFEYNVDQTAGHVDWNRDGVFAPDGTLVRAYANFRPGSGCEHTRWHQTRVPASATQAAPSIARLRGRMYVFSTPLGILRYAWSTSRWSCARPELTSCGSFAGWGDGPLYTNAFRGVDVARIHYGPSAGLDRLLVVAVDDDGLLWETRLWLSSSGVESWTTPTPVPGATASSGIPALTARGGIAYLVYRGPDGALRYNNTSASGGWSGDRAVLDQDGTPIVVPAFTAPAISWATLDHAPGVATLYGAFARSDGKLRLWARDAASGRWTRTDLVRETYSSSSGIGPVEGRPAMQWVPFQAGAEAPGQLYIVYPLHDTEQPNERELRMAMSYTTINADGTKDQYVGLNSPFDNVWLYGMGIDLLYDRGVDSNLRAAFTVGADYGEDNPDAPKKFQVWFRPVADGITNYRYTNHDDWQVLRHGICTNMVDPGKVIPDDEQIRCPPRTW